MSAPKNNKFAVGNNGGRPTKLTQEVLEIARTYLDQCKDSFSKENNQVELPSVAGFARYLDVGRRTIYGWAESNDSEANKEFLHILEEILAEQEKRLVDNGLAGKYNPTIAKLVLAKHGYTDKTDITSDGKGITIQFDVPFNTTSQTE